MIDYSKNPGWQTNEHNGKVEDLKDDEKALNKEGVLEALCEKYQKSAVAVRKDATKGGLVATILHKTDKDVIMVKGIHQAVFFSSNPRDQHRIDQTHYRVEWGGKQHHIYVQPNLAQKWDITEIT